MRTLVALCALLAACWAAPLSPALRPREIAGPRNLNRPFVFFESQRLPRGGVGKTTAIFTTTSNFGGQRRLSTDDLSAAVPADSSEARSEDSVASLIKSLGGSLQEKRRLDDSSEESSEEEDEGPSSASAPTPAQKSSVVIQDQVDSTGSSVASGGASTSISDFSPALLNAAIKQVHIPLVRPSLGGGEVKVISLTDGSSAVVDGATKAAGDAVVVTSVSQSAQQGKNSNGDSSVQSTATSAPEGENKHATDCKTAHEKITTGTADPKTPTNTNNLPLVLSGEPAISGEGASAQGIPGSAISLIQAAAQADSVPVKVSENVNQEQSSNVTSSTAAGNILQVPANSAGGTPADAGGNDGTSSPAHAELPRVNVGTSASSSALVQAPHSTGLSENQDDVLRVGSFNAQGSLAQTSGITVTGGAAAKDVSSDFKASEISASNSGDISVPGVQTSSITLTFLNGKHAEPSGSDKPQAADGGAEYTQLANGPGIAVPAPADGSLGTKEDNAPTSPSDLSTRPVDGSDTVVQSAPGVQASAKQPKGVQQHENTEDCKEKGDTQNETLNGKTQTHQSSPVQPIVSSGNSAITQGGPSGENLSAKNGRLPQDEHRVTTSGAGLNPQSNAVNTGESASSDIRSAAEDEILAFLRNSAGVIRFSSQDVKPISYKTSYVGQSPNFGVAAVVDTSSKQQDIEGGFKQGQPTSSSEGVTTNGGQIIKEVIPVVTDIRSADEDQTQTLLKNNAAQNIVPDQVANPPESKPSDGPGNEERPNQIPQLATISVEAQQATSTKQDQPDTSSSADGFSPETLSSSGSSRAAAEEEILALLKTNAGQNVLSSQGVKPSSDNQRDELGNTTPRKIFRVVKIVSAGDRRQLNVTEEQGSAHGSSNQPVPKASAEYSSTGTLPVTDSAGDAARDAVLSLSEGDVSPSGVFSPGAQGTIEQFNSGASSVSSSSDAKSAAATRNQASENQSEKVQDEKASSVPEKTRESPVGADVTVEARVAAQDEILSFLRDRAAKTKTYPEKPKTLLTPLVVTYGDGKPVGEVAGTSVGASDSFGLLNKNSGITYTTSVSKEIGTPLVANSALKEADQNASPQIEGASKDALNQQVNIGDEGSTSFYAGTDEVSTTKEKKLPINEFEVATPASSSDKTNSQGLNIEISHEQKPIDVSGIFKPVVYKPASPGNAAIDVSGIATSIVSSAGSSSNTESVKHSGSINDSGTIQTSTDDIKTEISKDDCNKVVLADGRDPTHEKNLNLPVTSSSSRLSSGDSIQSNYSTSENVQVENEGALQLSFKEGSGNAEKEERTVKLENADKGVIHVTINGDENFPKENNFGTESSLSQPVDTDKFVSGSVPGKDGVESLSFQEGKQVGLGQLSLAKGTPSVTEFKIEDETVNTAPARLPSSDIGAPSVTANDSRQEDDREAGGEDKPESHASGTTPAPGKSILTVISNMFSTFVGNDPKEGEGVNSNTDVNSQKNVPNLRFEDKPSVHPDNLSVGVHRGSAITVEAQGQPTPQLQLNALGSTDGQVITSSFVGTGNIEQNPLLRDSSAFIDEPKSEDGNYGQRISSRGQSTGVTTSGTLNAEIKKTLATPTVIGGSDERDQTSLVSPIISTINPSEKDHKEAPDAKSAVEVLPGQGQAQGQPIIPVLPATPFAFATAHESSSPSVEEGQLRRLSPGGSTVQVQFTGSRGDSTQSGGEVVSPTENEPHGEGKAGSGISAGVTTTDYSQRQKSVEEPGAGHNAPSSDGTLLHTPLSGVVDGSITSEKTLEASVTNDKASRQKPQNTIVVHVSDLSSPYPESTVTPSQKTLSVDVVSEQGKGEENVAPANAVKNPEPVGRNDGSIPSGVPQNPAAEESLVPVGRQPTSGLASMQPTSILSNTEVPTRPTSVGELSPYSEGNLPGKVVSGIPFAAEVSIQPAGTLPDDTNPATLPPTEGLSHQQPSGTLLGEAVPTGLPPVGQQATLQPDGTFPVSPVPGTPLPHEEASLQPTGTLPDNVVPSRALAVEEQAHLSGTSPSNGATEGPRPVGEQVVPQPAAPLPENAAPEELPQTELSVQTTGTSLGSTLPSVLPPVEGQARQQPPGASPGNALPAELRPIGGQVTLQSVGTVPENAVPVEVPLLGGEISQQPAGTLPDNAGSSGLRLVNEQIRQQFSGSSSPSTVPGTSRPVGEQVTPQPAGFLPDNALLGGPSHNGQPTNPNPVNSDPSTLAPVGGQAPQQPSATLFDNAAQTGQPPRDENTTLHPAGTVPDNAAYQGVPPVGGVSLQPGGAVPDNSGSARPTPVEDQKSLQPPNIVPDQIPQFVEPKPALVPPTADILRNPIQTELKETHQKGKITVALDELQAPAAVNVEAEQKSSPISILNTPSEVNSGQVVIEPPINKDTAPEVIPIKVVPVINKASEAPFENSPAQTPGIAGVNTVISIPQNEVQPGSSNQTPGPLLNTAAGEPQNPNEQAGEKTPPTVSTIVVTKINFDGPHSTQVNEPIKTELKDDARPKADVSSTSNDSPATISSTSSPEGTPTDTSKVSFVTYATEPSSVPVSSQEVSTEKGRTPTSTTSNDQASHDVSTVENSGTTSSGPESPNVPVMSLLYHGLVSASNDGTTQSTHLPGQPRPLGQSAGTNPPEENLKPSGVQPNPTTASLDQNNAQLVSSPGLLPTPLEASQQFNSQHQKTPLGTELGATVGASPHTTVLGDSLLSVHTPSKPTVLKLQSPYATRFFPNQLPQHTISPTPPPTSTTPEVVHLATSGQPQGPAFTNPQGSQPHTRIFFSPPSQNPKGQQQPLAAPPYFVSFRHDYVNPNKPTFPQGQVSYTTKQKVPAEVLLPHILSQEAAANEHAPGGDKGPQNRVRPQQPSPPSNSGPPANQQVFAPPSYNPGFSPHFSLAPGYKGPVTTIILNPDLSSPYQFGSYVPRSESSDQKREGLYKVKSFVPSVTATVPGSPAYTATSFVPDRQTYSQGGKVFKVTSFVPRGSRPVQGGFRQAVQPIPNGQRSFPSAPGRTVYRVAPVGSRRPQPVQRLQDLHVTVIGPGGQLRGPQQRVFNVARFAPQARAASARQGLQPAGSAQSRFPPFRGRPQQAIVEVRAVPIHFQQRPNGHRVTPSFHEQPLTFYDVPQRHSAGGPALRPSVASANGPGFPNGRARFQPVQVVRKGLGQPPPPQPLIASAAYQAPVFHGVTRVVIKPGQSIVSR